jgi:hypothetical protein
MGVSYLPANSYLNLVATFLVEIQEDSSLTKILTQPMFYQLTLLHSITLSISPGYLRKDNLHITFGRVSRDMILPLA